MTVTTLHEIPRDRYSRPLVIPPGGGKPVPYTRCTTFVGVLEDTFNLSRWQQRMVAIGLSERPDLLLQMASTDRDDKKAVNSICEAAMEAAKAHAAATIGTALHALTERMDRGQDVGVVPQDYQADLAAYQAATRDLTAVHIEQFSVQDDLRIGGTPDRIVEYDGRLMVADVKTGSIEWGILKIAQQLAVYAHSQAYDHTTGTRTPWGDVDLDTAIVIHLPAGRGTCELVEVDIAAGWDAVQVSAQVRDWRTKKNLSRPLAPAAATSPIEVPKPGPVNDDLAQAIASAASADALTALWADNQTSWTPQHTDLAASRKRLLAEAS